MKNLIVFGLILFAIASLSGGGNFLSADESIFSPLAPLPEEITGEDPTGPDRKQRGTIIRPYDIYDDRFCDITPNPFLCRECLSREEQFVQILSFDDKGVPVRSYACMPFQKPYLY